MKKVLFYFMVFTMFSGLLQASQSSEYLCTAPGATGVIQIDITNKKQVAVLTVGSNKVMLAYFKSLNGYASINSTIMILPIDEKSLVNGVMFISPRVSTMFKTCVQLF